MKRSQTFMVLGLLVGVLAGFAILASLMARDDSLPSDGDFAVARTELPKARNGWMLLAKASDSIAWPDRARIRYDNLGDNGWDDDLAERLLTLNEEVFAQLGAALAYERLQVPVVMDLDDDVSYVAVWQDIGRLLVLRARFLFRSGLDKEAFAEISRLMEFGHRVQEADGTLLHHLVGRSLMQRGLEQLQRMVGQTKLRANSVIQLVGRLGNQHDSGAGLDAAARREYWLLGKMLGKLESGKKRWHDIGLGEVAPLTIFGHVFLKNRTLRLYHDTLAVFRENIVRACAEMGDLPRYDTINGSSTLELLRMLFSRNSVGRLVHSISRSTLDRVLQGKCAYNTRLDGIRLRMAVLGYKHRYGELPESLSALAPEFIESLPVDAYSGQPFYYSRKRQVLYSVSRNLTNDEGLEPEDLVFDLSF